MFFFLTAQVLIVLLDFITIAGRSRHDKDIEILLLRQQLRVLQRKQTYPLRISRWEKLTLVVLARKLIVRTTRTRALSSCWATSMRHLGHRRYRQGFASSDARYPAGWRPLTSFHT